MHKTVTHLSTSTLLLLLLAGTASAQNTGTAGTTASPPGVSRDAGGTNSKAGQLARGDAAFLRQAAQNSHAEIEGSKLAQSKAVNTQVKTFAQQMVEDHMKTNAELAALASAKGVDLPDEPSIGQQARLKLLSAMDGAAFDRRYAQTIGVTAHEDTLKLFRKAAADAADPEVKAFAAKTVPALEHHLQMAKEIKAITDRQGSDPKAGAGTKS